MKGIIDQLTLSWFITTVFPRDVCNTLLNASVRDILSWYLRLEKHVMQVVVIIARS